MKIEEYLGLVSNLNDHSKNYLYHCIFVQFVYFMKESTLSRADSLTPAKLKALACLARDCRQAAYELTHNNWS